MRDRWIPDSSKFHKPIDEDSANEDALFVCGIFFYGYKKWGVIYGRNQEEIHGRSAHGSAPDQGKDAIVAVAAVVMGLQTLSSRVNDPQNTFVLTVGMMNGGAQSNIIADEVELVGTTRAFDKAFRKSLPRVGKVASKASRIGFCRYEKERGRSSQVRRLREHPIHRPKRKQTPPRCARQPLPREGARVDTPSFLWKEVPRRGGGWMGKAVSPTQSLPRVGKVASGASRIGF